MCACIASREHWFYVTSAYKINTYTYFGVIFVSSIDMVAANSSIIQPLGQNTFTLRSYRRSVMISTGYTRLVKLASR